MGHGGGCPEILTSGTERGCEEGREADRLGWQ